jgi:conjugal transfer pilus assembly protein TraF
MIKFLIPLFFYVPTLCFAFSYESVWDCKGENKFSWYCEHQEQAKKKSINLESLTAEQLRQVLKSAEDLAVINPSNENLNRYLTIWKFAQEKGAVFADSWRRFVWQNPDFDYSADSTHRGVNSNQVWAYDEQRNTDEEKYLSEIAKDNVLLYVFESTCPFCARFTPTLKSFGETYNFEVSAVSLDGRGVKDFPNPLINKEAENIKTRLNVSRVPALFIINKSSKDIAPIGFGVMSLSEIRNRIFVLTGTKPGTLY